MPKSRSTICKVNGWGSATLAGAAHDNERRAKVVARMARLSGKLVRSRVILSQQALPQAWSKELAMREKLTQVALVSRQLQGALCATPQKLGS